MSGGIVTGTNLWEFDGLKAFLICWMASGTGGKLVLATADWAPLAGSSLSHWTAMPADTPGEFLVEAKSATMRGTEQTALQAKADDFLTEFYKLAQVYLAPEAFNNISQMAKSATR